MTPLDKCPSCGLEHAKCAEEGFEDGFLMIPLPMTGLALCICPKCFTVTGNKECFDIQKQIKEKQEARIVRV